MTIKNYGFAFVLALGAATVGCAASHEVVPPGGGSGDGSGSGSGGGGGEGTSSLDASGKYTVSSTYDISTNMPGTVGVVVNDFINATSGPNQPTKWILDQIIAQMPGGTLKSLLQGAEPFVAGYLNDQLLSIAPQFVTTIVQVGNDFGDMAKHFGINETYDVAMAQGAYTATDTAVGIHFKVGTVETDLAFADYQMANVVVNNVGVTLDSTGKLTIAEHKLPLSYGKALHLGLDNVIIPLVDPNATDLASLLADLVDCDAVGQAIDDALISDFGFDLGNAGTWSAACTAGLQFGASAIYQQIDKIDASALEFDLTGSAKAVDTNGDHKVDSIQLGKWSGTLSYAGTPAPLATATFTGSRN